MRINSEATGIPLTNAGLNTEAESTEIIFFPMRGDTVRFDCLFTRSTLPDSITLILYAMGVVDRLKLGKRKMSWGQEGLA